MLGHSAQSSAHHELSRVCWKWHRIHSFLEIQEKESFDQILRNKKLEVAVAKCKINETKWACVFPSLHISLFLGDAALASRAAFLSHLAAVSCCCRAQDPPPPSPPPKDVSETIPGKSFQQDWPCFFANNWPELFDETFSEMSSWNFSPFGRGRQWQVNSNYYQMNFLECITACSNWRVSRSEICRRAKGTREQSDSYWRRFVLWSFSPRGCHTVRRKCMWEPFVMCNQTPNSIQGSLLKIVLISGFWPFRRQFSNGRSQGNCECSPQVW